VSRINYEPFFKLFNLLSVKHCKIHYDNFISNEISALFDTGNGGKRTEGIYDIYPELENIARIYAYQETKKKSANFTVKHLADFITEQYKLLSEDKSLADGEHIRSITSCRQDLFRWGCINDENKQMPYAQGHEDHEVVEYRKSFVKELDERKNLYYIVAEEDEKFNNKGCLEFFVQKFDAITLNWKIPIRIEPNKNGKQAERRRVLFSHDESTFKSGEMAKKRWRFGLNLPFHSKGRGR
jgi:hypothetical protein